MVRGGDRGRIVEREGEPAESAAALERAVAADGGVLVIEGPPGIGTTELLRAVREQARGRDALALCARGLEVECAMPFGAVRQLLEPVLRAASPREADRLLSGAARPAKRLSRRQPASRSLTVAFAMLNALYWVVAGLADVRPLALVVESARRAPR